MATQGKAKKVSKGLRRSCYQNRNSFNHPMSQAKFLQLSAQGGNRVQNDQIAKAMIAGLVSAKANPEIVKMIVSRL